MRRCVKLLHQWRHNCPWRTILVLIAVVWLCSALVSFQKSAPLQQQIVDSHDRSTNGQKLSTNDNKKDKKNSQSSNTTEAEKSQDDSEVWLIQSLDSMREPRFSSTTWFPHDANCSHYRTGFARKGRMATGHLASFPRSGNSWVRYLLEAASGLATCGGIWSDHTAPPDELVPAYLPEVRRFIEQARNKRLSDDDTGAVSQPQLLQLGFIGEDMLNDMDNCLLLKSHKPPDQHTTLARKRRPNILLLRDPFRAIRSFYHFSHGQSIYRNESSRNITNNNNNNTTNNIEISGQNTWQNFVAGAVLSWRRLAIDWAVQPRTTLVVHYEHLVAPSDGDGVKQQLQRMLRHLGVRVSAERMHCVLRHAHGIFHSGGGHENMARAFTKNQRAVVWRHINSVNQVLISRGYHRLPLEKYSFYDYDHH